jgi:hypothetical protein
MLPLPRREHVDTARPELVAVLLQPVERGQHRAHVTDQRFDGEGVVTGFVARAGEHENTEVGRVARQLR